MDGYDYIVGEGILKVNEIERVVVNRIYDEYIKGTSMLGICKIMNDENVQTKRGGKLNKVEQFIIKSLFGIDCEKKNQLEVSKLLNISQKMARNLAKIISTNY